MKENKQLTFFQNMSWIFIGNMLHAILSFSVNILVARCLSTNDNGIINYALSWISFYNAIASLGINNVINKFTNDNISESNKVLNTAIIFRILSGFLGIIFVYITVLCLNPEENTVLMVALIQSLSIMFAAGDTLVFWFRYKKEANIVAKLRILAFLFSAVIRIIAIMFLENIYIYTLGVVLETLIFSLLLIYEYRKRYTKKIVASLGTMKMILKSSYPFIFSAVLATLYAQTDKIMLKSMLDNNAVAYYSISVTLAGLMSIIVSAIIEGFRPEILLQKNNKNMVEYHLRLRQAYCITFWICILYGIFITFFSKQVIYILYGEKYLPAQPALALIVWYTSFSYFGTINNIYMVAENQEKWVQLTTLVGAVVNIILNYLFIPILGIQGAALASLATQFIANFIMPFMIKDLREINTLIIQGIMFKDINISSIKHIIRKFL